MKVIQSTKYLQSAVAVSSVGLMLLFAAILVPVYHDELSAEATLGVATESTLTFTSSNSVASVSFEVGSKDGTFATSTEEEKARFAISTNNYTGYTLRIRTSDYKLINENDSSKYFDYGCGGAGVGVVGSSFGNDEWGFIPNVYVDNYDNTITNDDLYFCVNTAGMALAKTDGPNSVNGIDNADEYTIGIGLKADYTKPSGIYTNGAFVIEYAANVTPYNISFGNDTGDNSVADLPNSLSGSNVSSVIITNSSTPTRTGYTFAGKWCLGRTDDNGTTCDGTVYNVGDSFGIDRTENNNNITLYAMWTPNDYDLTINFTGDGVESVKVCTESGDCSGDSLKATISASGGNVTLTYGQNYYLYPTLTSGYETDGWEVTGTGRISSTLGTDTNPTFAVGADDVQSVTVEGGKVCNPSGSTISDVVCMQDISSTNKTDVFNSMAEGDQYILKDSRDRKKYMVARLADDNIWMTQNLDHNIGDIADGTYTSADTDLPSGSSWTPASSEYTTDGSSWNFRQIYVSESYDPGNLCWNGTPESSAVGECNSSNIHYHLGNYYNWTAAVAMSNSQNKTGDVNQSICPAGWMLPKNGTGNGSFEKLIAAYGWNSSSSTMSGDYQMWDSPLYFTLGGHLYNGSWYSVDSHSLYWSSVVYDQSFSYRLRFDSSGSASPNNATSPAIGIFVRCVAR